MIGARRSGGAITRCIVLLLRLGLRRGEVARGLRLMTSTGAPVSWWFMARPPARIGCRCPPMSVRRSSPICAAGGRLSDRREVFLRAKAPYEPIAPGRSASTVRRACRRAGIPEVGAHRLRHTAACEMVEANVPLLRIGQVLRHRSLQSTAIYARVDLDQLRQLAHAVAREGER